MSRIKGKEKLEDNSKQTTKNAEGFLAGGGVDGLLVGRDSLNASHFSKILQIADKV